MPSTVIDKMIYDEAANTLRVVFVSGDVYQSHKVPAAVYNAIKKASSKGRYLNKFIKGNYSYRKIN